jgi:hypothetical protein
MKGSVSRSSEQNLLLSELYWRKGKVAIGPYHESIKYNPQTHILFILRYILILSSSIRLDISSGLRIHI